MLVIVYSYLNKLSMDAKIIYVSAYNKVWQSISHWYLAETVLTNLLSVPYDIAEKTLIVTLYF